MSLRAPFECARVLTGPTGAGKTRIALDLAVRLGAEIVSMDSMAVYRGMDIGTAKPTLQERAVVPHHLIDLLDPWESANVAWWLAKAEVAARDIVARGKSPLFVGGTPLYLKALIFGLFEGPPADEALRERLKQEAERDGPLSLHRRLAAVDPAAAQRIHRNDTRRVIRALEVFELTGRPISEWQTEWRDDQPSPAEGDDDPKILWIDWPRESLGERIDRRVDAMFAAGLLDEVRGLLEDPRGISREAAQALGYREAIAHLEGRMSRDEAVSAVKTHSRQFAKRQVTWFRHLPGCFPIDPESARNHWQFSGIKSKIAGPISVFRESRPG